MNKITLIGMPMHRLYVIVMFLCLSNFSFSQTTYTTLKKNINTLAYNLDHNLSSTQDSLILENKFLFRKVRISSKTTEKVYDFKPAVKRAKIPLGDLPVGKYTVMFYQADKIIVFQIHRVLPFEDLAPIYSDLAINDVNETVESEITIADIAEDLEDSYTAINYVKDVDLDYESRNVSLASNGTNLDMEDEMAAFKETYNISNMNRNNVQTRAEYRRNNLRPNGKPYND